MAGTGLVAGAAGMAVGAVVWVGRTAGKGLEEWAAAGVAAAAGVVAVVVTVEEPGCTCTADR